MSVETTESFQEYTADGNTAYFAFNFNYSAASEISVGQRVGDNDFQIIDASNYQIIQNPDTNGGQIRFVANPSGSQIIDAPPAQGVIVRIERDSDLTSDATWQVALEMPALIGLFDRLFRAVQENRNSLSNYIQTFPTQHAVKLFELLAQHQNKILYWDNDTQTIMPTPFPLDNVVQATGGMWFRERFLDNATWLEYSLVDPSIPNFNEANWKQVYNLTALLQSIIPPKPSWVEFGEFAPIGVIYNSNGTAALSIGFQGS